MNAFTWIRMFLNYNISVAVVIEVDFKKKNKKCSEWTALTSWIARGSSVSDVAYIIPASVPQRPSPWAERLACCRRFSNVLSRQRFVFWLKFAEVDSYRAELRILHHWSRQSFCAGQVTIQVAELGHLRWIYSRHRPAMCHYLKYSLSYPNYRLGSLTHICVTRPQSSQSSVNTDGCK